MKINQFEIIPPHYAEVNISITCDCGKNIYHSDEIECDIDSYSYNEENVIKDINPIECPDCKAQYEVTESGEDIKQILGPDMIRADRIRGQLFIWPEVMKEIKTMERINNEESKCSLP